MSFIAILTFCFVAAACIVGLSYNDISNDYDVYCDVCRPLTVWNIGADMCSFIAFFVMFAISAAITTTLAIDVCSMSSRNRNVTQVHVGHACRRCGLKLKDVSIKPGLDMRYMISAFDNSGAYEDEINAAMGDLLKKELSGYGSKMAYYEYRFSLHDVTVDIRNSTVVYSGEETNKTYKVTLPIAWSD